MTSTPLFQVQIVCWFTEGQEVEFNPQHMRKLESIGNGLEIDTALQIIKGKSHKNGQFFYMLDIGYLKAKDSLEIGLQIHKQGTVNFEPVSYTTDNKRQVLKKGSEIALPFQPPFDMDLHAVSLWIGRSEASRD